MARGDSPRLVVDVGVELKRRFHSRIALDGTTVKDWVTERIETYLGGPQQLAMSFDATAGGSAEAARPMMRERAAEYGSGAASTPPTDVKKPAGRNRRKRKASSKGSRSNQS